MVVGSTGVHQAWAHVDRQGKFQEIFVLHELVKISKYLDMEVGVYQKYHSEVQNHPVTNALESQVQQQELPPGVPFPV